MLCHILKIKITDLMDYNMNKDDFEIVGKDSMKWVIFHKPSQTYMEDGVWESKYGAELALERKLNEFIPS